MKQCPKCHKNIPQDAKICPYCGHVQPGYKPMKKSRPKSRWTYTLLAFFLMFSPMIFSYFFMNTWIDLTSPTSQDNITIGEYQETSQDQVEYQYDSLESFEKSVNNSDQYINHLKQREKALATMFGSDNIVSDHIFQVTTAQNVYTQAIYDITINDRTTLHIETVNDIDNYSDCQISYTISQFENIADIEVDQQTLGQVATIFDGSEDNEVIQQATASFQELLPTLDNQDISHYGLGVSESNNSQKCAIRIFDRQGYQIKMTYSTNLNS